MGARASDIAFAGEGPESDSVEVSRPARDRLGARNLVVAAIAAVVLIVGVVAWQFGPTQNPAIAGSTAITAEQLEQQYGVRLGVIGLLASGGLVELKFQVIDADKATALFGEVEDMPMLAVEGSTEVLESARGMKHQLVLLDGASYFFLYTNVGNSVHEGSTVAFVINGVRIPNLPVLR